MIQKVFLLFQIGGCWTDDNNDINQSERKHSVNNFFLQCRKKNEEFLILKNRLY